MQNDTTVRRPSSISVEGPKTQGRGAKAQMERMKKTCQTQSRNFLLFKALLSHSPDPFVAKCGLHTELRSNGLPDKRQ